MRSAPQSFAPTQAPVGYSSFADDVLQGLTAKPKSISAKYFYDDAGSKLFQLIMQLPEYYLTACEREVFEDQAATIASLLPKQAFDLVELGAGDGSKTLMLLQALLQAGQQVRYLPIDISAQALEDLATNVHCTLPTLQVQSVVAEYGEGLNRIRRESQVPCVVLFLGSTIGNFTPTESQHFLSSLQAYLHPGDSMLVGFDLKKDPQVLLPAYDDAAGITRQFNLNLLRRINRELQANFVESNFRHYAFYNAAIGAMESCLLSLKSQQVHIQALEATFQFDAWEALHTEYSFKFSQHEVESLATATGFKVVQHFFCRRAYFMDTLLQVT